MKKLVRRRGVKKVKKKIRRSHANNDAEIYPGRGGYIVCPDSPIQSAIHPKVCRINHYFWNDSVFYKTGSEFAKKHCRHCTFWKRYVPSELRELTARNKRKYFLVPLQKYVRDSSSKKGVKDED